MSLNSIGVARIAYMNVITSGEKPFTSFGVINNIRGKDGEEGHMIPCVAFGKTGELINEYFTVGSRIELKETSLTSRKQQTQGGDEYNQISMVVNRFDFVDSKDEQQKHFAKHPKDAQGAPAAPQQAAAPMAPAAPQAAAPVPQAAAPAPAPQAAPQAAPAAAPATTDFEDDIPF